MSEMRNDVVRTVIDGYDVELDFFVENGEQRCFGQVNYVHPASKADFSASLTVLEAYGWLDAHAYYGVHEVSDDTRNKIFAWADKNGY